MKKYGFVQSNIYALKSENDLLPRLSYCEMEENPGYNSDMEKLIGYINYSPVQEIVMFSAYDGTSGNNFFAGDYITFNEFHADHASHFDLASGTFVTPIDGVFEFDFSLYYDLYNAGYVKTKVEAELNGRSIAVIRAQRPSEKGIHQGYFSHKWTVDLNQNDAIRLKVTEGRIFSGYEYYSVFNGKYIRPLSIQN